MRLPDSKLSDRQFLAVFAAMLSGIAAAGIMISPPHKRAVADTGESAAKTARAYDRLLPIFTEYACAGRHSPEELEACGAEASAAAGTAAAAVAELSK